MRMSVLLALVFMLLAVVPVSAGAPEVTTEVYSDWDHIILDAGDLCDFAVWDNEYVIAKTTTWFDSEGNPLKQEIRYKGWDRFHMENSDVVLSGKFSATVHIDMLTGETTISGILAHITIPGYGTVFMLTGRNEPTPYGYNHLAGKSSFESEQDIAQFCSALAGN